MNRLSIILAVVILPAWVLPAQADGIFGLFGKKAKVDPVKRVAELIVTLKTEQDDRKRASAASELGTFDAAAFPEIVPVLVDVLQHDTKPGVRMDAASSLSSIRPISQVAGDALDKSASNDDNLRVRLHAKSIVMKYRFAGYSPGTKTNPVSPKTPEPPLLNAHGTHTNPQAVPMQAQYPAGANTVTNTSGTKFTAPKNQDTPEFRPSVPRPLPQGPSFSTSMPQEPIQAAPPVLPMVETDGPPLTPLPNSPYRTPTPVPPLPPAAPPQAPVSPF